MLFLDTTPELTETELLIYRTIMEDLDAVSYMRIRELADRTFTSTASIQRFCRKFNCSGWAEFKTKLQLYKQNQLTPQSHLDELDSGMLTRAIRTFDSGEERRQLQAAATLLATHEATFWLGDSESKLVAAYGASIYSSAVNMAVAITDPVAHPLITFPEGMIASMCFVVCATTGDDPAVMSYVRALLKLKVPVIAITNSDQSPLAKLATLTLPYYITPQRLGDTNLTSQVPALYLVEQLTRMARA